MTISLSMTLSLSMTFFLSLSHFLSLHHYPYRSQRVLLEREAAGHTAAAALSVRLQQRLAAWVDMLRDLVGDDE